jgi:hypothetical protein
VWSEHLQDEDASVESLARACFQPTIFHIHIVLIAHISRIVSRPCLHVPTSYTKVK